jgi:2-haloacid dehalogenase
MTRWLTFDCYGTLIDWRHGIATAGELVFPGRGAQLLEAYRAIEPEVEARRPFPRYRRVLAESFRGAAARLGLPAGEDEAGVLADTLPYWPVFADVGPVLGSLRESGWNLAILTNCDRDLIALTQRRLPVAVDAVVTAEDVGAYKPEHAQFERFRAAFGAAAEAWVHVAQSHRHDVRPASQLGIPTVWINRLGEPFDPSLAAAVLPDLGGLPDTIARLSAGAGGAPSKTG